jgi:hypothetical protein
VDQSIVSYTLFDHPEGGTWRHDITIGKSLDSYARYLPTLIRAHHAVWPGWQMRLHYSPELEEHPYYLALWSMHRRKLIELCACEPAPSVCGAMMWRMYPVFDYCDRVVVCADLDSFPSLKQRLCVEGFIASGRTVMLTHDCETHDGVLGGGIAVRSRRFRELVGTPTYEQFLGLEGGTAVDLNTYSSDEEYLKRVVWPRVQHDAMIYSSSGKTQLECSDIRRNVQGIDYPEDIHPQVAIHGNDFGPYIGASGYDLVRARTFLDSLGLPAIKAIAECERE